MWLKIKVWTKVTIAVLIALYALLFIYNNTGKQVDFWWWFSRPTTASVFTLSFLSFLSGAVVAILVRTTFVTLTQIRELQRRSKAQRLEREIADMKSKAGMLKQRDIPPTASPPPPDVIPLEDEPL